MAVKVVVSSRQRVNGIAVDNKHITDKVVVDIRQIINRLAV